MMATPNVSVIVPVFNGGQRLAPSIKSLLGQTLKGLEIIVVNDASVDNTRAVIERLAKDNENIVPIHFDENKGVHEARLAGLKKSTAPWIGFLDADDFARPNMFRTLLAAAVQNDVDIVICGSDRVTEQRKVIAPKLRFRRSEKVQENIFEKFCAFEFGTGMLCNKLYRRSVIEPSFKLHFPWRQSINEDLLMNIGCFYRAASVILLKEVLHEYVLNQSSVTSSVTTTNAYVDTYRAAALAVGLCSELGEDALPKVIDLYRTQLSWSGYQIANTASLIPFEKELREAVDLINKVSPSALALFAARNTAGLVGTRLALKSFVWSVLRMLRLTFGAPRR